VLAQKQIDQVTDQFLERLKSLGYIVTPDVAFEGKSGARRSFDYVADLSHGFVGYTVAIDVITDAEDPETSLQRLFNFEDKCSDGGIEYSVVIAIPRLGPVAAQFALRDGIGVFDIQGMQAFLTHPAFADRTAAIPQKLRDKGDVARSLRVLGYQVEERAKITGGSGVHYSLDLLARLNDGFVSAAVAIDQASGDMIDLGQLSLFDAKCSDVGIRERVLLVSGKLTSAAKEFAEQHRIMVVVLEPEVRADESASTTTTPPKTFTMRSVIDQLLVPERKPKGKSADKKKSTSAKSKAAEEALKALAEVQQAALAELEAATAAAGTEGKIPIDEPTEPESAIPASAPETPTAIEEAATDYAGEVQALPELEQALDGSDGEAALDLLKTEESIAEAAYEPSKEEALMQQAPETTLEVPPLEPDLLDQPAPASEEGVIQKPPEPEPKAKKPRLAPQPPIIEEEVEKPKVKLRKATRPEALRLIPESTARKFTVIPINITDNNILEVAMVNPSDIVTIQVLEHQSRMRIRAVPAEKKEIQDAIDFNYKGFGQIAEQIARIDVGPDAAAGVDLVAATANAPVAAALNLIIEEGVKARASDIHIEPEEKRLRVRYRIDGVLHEVMSLPIKIHPPLASRVKVMSDLNIADHLRPQDGQFSTEVKGKQIDVRVATSPTVHGETVVMRLLDKSVAVMDLGQLGFAPEALVKFQKMLSVPFGMILVSGPTGAGKTTTLYAAVNTLDKVTRNIITVEDPVEYRFENIKQIQVNPKAGLTFAGVLRSMMRLDPDVILVGEIRDGETATIAVKSALTGHLVLSSIHANDAIGVIYRLLDLGVEPFLVASVITGSVAQRMVRRVCLNCAAEVKPSPSEQAAYMSAMGEELESFLSGSGCDLCSYSGYRGRMGLFEVLNMSDAMRAMILRGATLAEVREQSIKEGMDTLLRDGMQKVKQGMTTVSEVLRNAYSID
jgi:general secretion pathway protein E